MADGHVISMRPIKAALVEYAAVLALVAVSAVLVSVTVAVLTSPDALLAVAQDAGETLLSPMYEFLPAVAGALIGLFAVSVGGQLLGDPAAANKTRRRLGAFALLLAVAPVLPLLLVGLYCVSEPKEWAAMFILVPEMALVLFLALQTSMFAIWEPHERRANAIEAIELVDSALSKVPAASTRPTWLLILMHGLVAAAVSALLAMAFDLRASIVISTGVVAAITLALFGCGLRIGLGTIMWSTTPRLDLAMKIFLVIVLLTGPSLARFGLGAIDSYSWFAPIAMSAALAFGLLSLFLPINKWVPWLHSWTYRSIAASCAIKSLMRERSSWEEVLDEHPEEIERGRGPRLLIRRVLATVSSIRSRS